MKEIKHRLITNVPSPSGMAYVGDATAIESPYAPGQEFGPEVDELDVQLRQLGDEIDDRYRAWRTRYVNWCGEPQYAEEARRAAKGQVTASGVQGFVAPPVKAIDDSKLARAFDAVNAALDRLMRSKREE